MAQYDAEITVKPVYECEISFVLIDASIEVEPYEEP